MADSNTGRPALGKNTDEPITSEAPGVPSVKAGEQISVYPRVVRTGGLMRSYEGLGGSMFSSPYNTRWPNGRIPAALRAQMMQHDKVSQSVNNLKNAILGDGGRTIPCLPPSHPEFAKAREIAEFCDAMFRHTAVPYHYIAFQMLDCVIEGNKVAPVVWRDETTRTGKTVRVLDRLHVWPNELYHFARDEFGNIDEIRVGRRPPQQVRWPRKKFFVLTFRPVNGNPQGQSVLEAAYTPYYDDIMTDSEEGAYVATFGRPSVVIYAAPPPVVGGQASSETPQPLFMRDGSPVMEADPDNPGEIRHKKGFQTEQNALLFTDWQAGSVWSLPGGSKVDVAEARAGGADMFRFKRESNHRRIAAAIYGTHQMTESERNVSTNNAEVGEGVAGLNVTYGKVMLELAEENDILRTTIEMNFGKAALDYLPIRDYGSGQNGRIPKVLNGVVGFVSNGAFTKDQWWWFCAGNGLPLPYPDSEPVVTRVQGTGGGDKTGSANPADENN